MITEPNDSIVPEGVAALSDGSSIDLKAGRRAFMRTMGLGALGTAVFAAADGNFSEANAQSFAPSDIAQFALNFEYLGATFYLTAVTGQGLSAADIGSNPGQVTGGSQNSFQSPVVQALAVELAIDERSHVEVLRALLTANGVTPISRPALNIGTAFTSLAQAAGIVGPTGTFSPYVSDMNFLLGAFVFEDVCVTALKGSAAMLMGSPYLATLSGYLGVEAYQAGSIRTMLFGMAQTNQQVANDTSAIAQTRSALANQGNPNADDIGIGSLASPHLVTSDSNAIAFGRTPRQVLNIAYGAAGASAGGFFPNGVNGNIR